MQEPVRKRRFPMINMGDDAEISYVRCVHLQKCQVTCVECRGPHDCAGNSETAHVLLPRKDTGKWAGGKENWVARVQETANGR
jgi:hypothetical protein